MDVSNSTGQNSDYRISAAGQRSFKIAASGTSEARREEFRAERDIQEGRYETFKSAEDFARKYLKVPGKASGRRVITSGELEPGGARHVPVETTSGNCWTVEFLVDGKVVASSVVRRKSASVVLKRAEEGFRVEVV